MKQQLLKELQTALSQIEGANPELANLNPATKPEFGDLQSNVAMQHAKILRRKPLDIAADIASKFTDSEYFAKVEVAPPGFLNFTLKSSSLHRALDFLDQDVHVGIPQFENQPVIVVDYSSPNVAKTMHVAHLRSTIIGDAIKRILLACGAKVIADNHIGDWGTQFGKLLYAYKNFDHEAKDKDSVAHLEHLYQSFVKQAKENESLNDHARSEVAALQRKEEPNYSLWKKFIEISLKEFQSVYERLDIQFDHQYGESHYNDFLQDVVDELKLKGVCKESEGAQVVFFENDEFPPVPVQKKDGSFLYSTTDIATVNYRINEFSPKSLIYVTDNRQKLHFQQFFKISNILGWNVELNHVPFGLMKFGQGAIMSTKEGQVISLKDFLDEAEKRAYQVLRESDYNEDQKLEIARVVGISAVKYQDLSQNPSTDITFTWDKALNLEGNSAPYLLYAYARVQSIHRKFVDQYKDVNLNTISFDIQHDIERQIANHILHFGEVVHSAAKSNKPNIVADYIYNLASKFATFYNQLSILKEEDAKARNSRMKLALLTAKVLKKGLTLLGIDTLDRM